MDPPGLDPLGVLTGRDRGHRLGLGLDQQEEPVRMPLDLQNALDDAESLLLATGHATFDLPEGFRMFPLPTERIM